ncbi:hypothetical protein DEH69_21350 [Streptomyces sp. PT12]|nr:hypothetical protein DEH69_21350 [Streptomyces sp. PT12]
MNDPTPPAASFTAVGPVHLRLAALGPEGPHTEPLSCPHPGGPCVADMTDWVVRATGNAVFREAIAVSSPSLHGSILRIRAGDDIGRKKLRRVVSAVARYALRISGRPSPFGLQAGVVPARFGERAASTVDGAADRVVRLDAAFADVLALRRLEDPEARRALDVAFTDLVNRRGEHLHFPRARKTDDANDPVSRQALTLRATPLLLRVRDTAARPIRYADLLAKLLADAPGPTGAPGPSEAALDRYLLDLLRHDVLTTPEGLRHLDVTPAARADGVPGQLATLIREYEATAPGDGADAWHAVVAEAERLAPGVKPATPQVDLRFRGRVELPPSVREEAQALATALWRVFPRDGSYAHMRRYREEFEGRYGVDAPVPLPDLIDPHRGLGFPDSYNVPRAERFAGGVAAQAAPGGDADQRRTRRLARLLHRGLTDPSGEVVLGPADIDELATAAPGDSVGTLDVCFQLHAPSRAAVDAGDFLLFATPVTGAQTAGAMSGRFAATLGNAAELGEALAAPDDGVLPAQLLFPQSRGRVGNVLRTPPLLPHRIPFGLHADPGAPGHIDWRDVLVVAEDGVLRAVWERTGQYLRPVLPHMLDASAFAPNAARLLAELRFTDPAEIWGPWKWGTELGELPFLPRVRLGRSVLSPRSWLPEAPPPAEDEGPGAFDRWREGAGLPRRVVIGREDRYYGVDLAVPLHRALLRKEMAEGGERVHEDPRADGDAHGWLEGRSHEIVVPMAPAAPPARRTVPPRRSARAPADAWAYVKVYAVRDSQDALIVGPLADLVRSVGEHADGWFFLRYADPVEHVRLRLRAAPGALRHEVWPRLTAGLLDLADQGVIRDHAVARYEPEQARYGGPAGIGPAEEIFCLDSQLALAGLRALRRPRSRLTADALIAADYAVLLDALGPWDWPRWAAARFERSVNGEVAPAALAAARELIRPGETAARLEAALAVRGLAAAWREAPGPRAMGELLGLAVRPPLPGAERDAALLSLLHMQHNRLVGTGHQAESASLKLLGHVARGWLGADAPRTHRSDAP